MQSPEPHSTYAVGYCRPPLHTRFQKGASGNPAGRPRKPRRPRRDLLERIVETALRRRVEVPAGENGRPARRVSLAQKVVEGLELAVDAGDVKAMRELMLAFRHAGRAEARRREQARVRARAAAEEQRARAEQEARAERRRLEAAEMAERRRLELSDPHCDDELDDADRALLRLGGLAVRDGEMRIPAWLVDAAHARRPGLQSVLHPVDRELVAAMTVEGDGWDPDTDANPFSAVHEEFGDVTYALVQLGAMTIHDGQARLADWVPRAARARRPDRTLKPEDAALVARMTVAVPPPAGEPEQFELPLAAVAEPAAEDAGGHTLPAPPADDPRTVAQECVSPPRETPPPQAWPPPEDWVEKMARVNAVRGVAGGGSGW